MNMGCEDEDKVYKENRKYAGIPVRV